MLKKGEIIPVKPVYTCSTLRRFLKQSGHKLTTGAIPYSKLFKKGSSKEKKSRKESLIDQNIQERIEERIFLIESQQFLGATFLGLPYSSKLFAMSYLLFNLQFICKWNQAENMKDSSKCDVENIQFAEKIGSINIDFCQSIEDFLTISDDSTYCLENLVEQSSNTKNDDIKRINKKRLNHKENAEKNAEKLYEIQKYTEQFDESGALKEFSEDSDRNMCSTNLTSVQDYLISQLDGLEDDSSSSDEELKLPFSPFHQIDGNQDFQRNRFNGLTAFDCQSELLSATINVLRSFETFWIQFKDHSLCKTATNKDGQRCLFCSVRSFSLRVNRAKIKKHMKPSEIFSLTDQLPNENHDFNDFFSEMLRSVNACEDKFINTIFGNSEICMSCSNKVSFSSNFVINLESSRETIKPTLEQLIARWLEKIK